MIAAIVVPAGARSIAMMRACLVSARIIIFEDEGANRARVLDLLVDREVERTAALGFVLGLVMESSEVRATPSAAPPQPRRANHPAGRDPKGRLSRSNSPQQRSDQGRKRVISEQIVTGRAQNPAFRTVGSNPTLSAILREKFLFLSASQRCRFGGPYRGPYFKSHKIP
jgi:hypothetical protein